MPRRLQSVASLATVWVVPSVGLLLGALVLFALGGWLYGRAYPDSGAGWLAWVTAIHPETALEAVSNAAEVVAGVLAIAITAVAIVVELAAGRYTHHITRMFVREPVNALVMGFFVLTTLYCFWVTAALSPPVPGGPVMLALALITVSLLALLPYFAFVFAFVQPMNFVDRVRAGAMRAIRQASGSEFRLARRKRVVTGLIQLEDITHNSLEHNDRTIAMAGVNALHDFLLEYQQFRGELDDRWYRLDQELLVDPDFVAMERQVQQETEERKIWFEVKILRQYYNLYSAALYRMRNIAYLIALNTRRIAVYAIEADHGALLDITVRSINSYLRAVINQKDVRTAYYTLFHYRRLAEEAIERNRDPLAVMIARHLRFYALIANNQQLPFLLEVTAYDLRLLCEMAFEGNRPCAGPLLDVMLTLDREVEHVSQESSLHGVRRAQVQLATFFMAAGNEERARMIWRDMEQEDPDRLAAVRNEILREISPRYFEVTDRGAHFSYLPPERREHAREFFRWFGDRIPPEQTFAEI